MTKQHLHYIDNLRGVLILLVIVGHCIQNLDEDFDHNIVFRYIYSFHMPLFMFLSGFVSYKTEYMWESVKRRFIQLVIPFVAWAFLGMSINGSFDFKWLTHPDTALWFLWVLFWIGLLHLTLSKLSKKFNIKEEIVLGISCIIFICILLFSKLLLGFHLVAWYLPFYCMGSFSMKYRNNLMPILSNARWLLLFMFIVLAYFWMRNQSPLFLNFNSQIITFLYKFIVGIIGCLCFLALAQSYDYKVMYISELGGVTLGIYAIHQTIIRLVINANPYCILDRVDLWFQCIIVFIAALIITLLGYWGLSRSKLTSKIFLGK